MTGFRFRSNLLTLDIEGHIFEIEMTNEFLKKMNEYSALCGEQADYLRDGGSGKDGAAEDLLSSIIDRLLGDGASDMIFDGRKRDLFDLCDVVIYICDECERFQSEKIKKYRELLRSEEEERERTGMSARRSGKEGLYGRR